MANIRTFKNIQDEVLAWLDEAGDTTVTLTLVKQAIRAAHEKRLTEERWQFMLARPRTFTVVAGEQYYALDAEFQRPLYFRNLTTGDLLVEYTDQNAMESGQLQTITQDGTAFDGPCQYALWGHSEVSAQPAEAAVMHVTSSNVGDVGTASVTITGRIADGSIVTETFLCEDVTVGTSVTSSTNEWTEIIKFTKGTTWGGTLTAYCGATTMLTLLPAEYGKSYQLLYLLAPPSGGDIIEYRYYRQPSTLTLDGTRPDFPSPFETLLVWDALLDLATYNEYAPNMVGYWVQKRDALLLGMQQSTNVAQSINRRASYTEYIPR